MQNSGFSACGVCWDRQGGVGLAIARHCAGHYTCCRVVPHSKSYVAVLQECCWRDLCMVCVLGEGEERWWRHGVGEEAAMS